MYSTTPPRRFAGLLILILAAAIAVASARPYAGSWHDGSRLAVVESLIDYHTWAIDQSIFVHVPAYPDGDGPYPDGELQNGTQDKLLIDGRFYTDKPVPSLLLAGVYQLWRWCGGPTAREAPGWFCWLMVLAGAGLPYVVAAGCIDRMAGVLRLPLAPRLALTASFALATLALPYVRQVNVHIMFLGAIAGIGVGVANLAERSAVSWRSLAVMGSLAGLAFTFDVGTGTPLLLGLVGFVALRCRALGPVLITTAAALPWIALHQAINYAIGGTWRPINMVPEYATWPGSPFTFDILTGSWKHSLATFLPYSASMLFGKRGFLLHNLPLVLLIPSIILLWRRRPAVRVELLFLVGWCVATWLTYACLSNNSSGVCCSIRWFLPLLVPAYYVLALLLREWPRYLRDFCVLSGWGLVSAGLMWREGPWMAHMVPFYWPLVATALLSWWGCHGFPLGRRGRHPDVAPEAPQQELLVGSVQSQGW